VRRAFALVVVTLTLAVACASGSGGSTPSATSTHLNTGRQTTASAIAPSSIAVRWHTVVRGLDSPLTVTTARDGTGRMFITEQPGLVRIVRQGSLVSRPYLDIRDRVTSGGEQGLLSIAFHPKFREHPRIVAAYTRANGDLVVTSYRATRYGANHLDPSTGRRIIIVPHDRASNHNGGQVFFGRSGLLYITTGDGGSEGDQFNLADKRTNLTGKVLRIDIDRRCGTHNYCIPSSNPYAHSTRYRREVLDWGLRNPWRASQDPVTSRLWIGDVGQNRYEEIDSVGTRKAHDFGWSCKEGRTTYNSSRCAGRTLTGPVAVTSHDTGNCAVIGGYVVRSPYASFVHGLYVFGDYCSGHIWGTVHPKSGGYRTARIGSISGSLSGFGLFGGRLYAVTLDGVLYRASFVRS